MESQNNSLLDKIRTDFGFFGGLSFVFGIFSALLFYKAGIGLNSFIFTFIIAIIILLMSKKADVLIQQETALCLLAAIMLGLSNVLSSSFDLRFLNNVGILLLLDYSLNRTFKEKKPSGFLGDLINLIVLPFKALSSVGYFAVDLSRFTKDKKFIKNDKYRNILIGCIITVPLFLIIIRLLSSADLLFGKITKTMFSWIISSEIFIILILVILGTFFCYSLLCGSTKEVKLADQLKAKASPTIGITISSIMLTTYILFCSIQILYLFAGGIFTLPEEFTYAEYARRGFFELLVVTGINIILTLVCVNVFEDNKPLRTILTAITACTYIMIASAAYRMLLYIGAYHLTFLRLFVLLFLLIDALILAGVIISLYKKDFPLFGYSVAVITICYLVFSLSRPDYHIAKYFVNHTDKIESEDLYYLTSELSLDAAQVVLPLLDENYDYDISYYKKMYYNRISSIDPGIRDYNYSFNRAKKLIKEK